MEQPAWRLQMVFIVNVLQATKEESALISVRVVETHVCTKPLALRKVLFTPVLAKLDTEVKAVVTKILAFLIHVVVMVCAQK